MTYDAVPLIPRAVLFGNPTYAAPAISPDGTRLGYLAPDEGVLNVFVGPVDDPTAARPVTHDRGRGVRVFGFCHDDRTLFYLQDDGGDENWRLHLLDLASGTEECVTPWDDVQVGVIGHNRWHPTTMLLRINKDNVELFDVWQLDLESRRIEKVLDNPGNFVGWIVDSDLRVRGGSAMTEDGGQELYLGDDTASDSGEFRLWKTVPSEDTAGTGILGFSRDGRTLYYVSSIEANASRLIAVDLGSGTETVLAADDAYDVSGVELDPETRVPQAAIFEKDRNEWVFLDPELEATVSRLRTALGAAGAPDGELGITRPERSDRIWQVSVMPSDGPVHYYVYDRAPEGPGSAPALRFLFVHKPDLADYELAPMEPFTFTARDGLELHGYLTFPPGVERTALPAVLNVHGGPWARDSWGYHPEAQWLANRGYVSVQVNYRGSTGYGKAFGNAGDKEWGRAMHTDLLDALEHLVENGVVDR
ncbi:MAG TPA: prolyl oligopeptidase family serine peptidase, partial [Actinopolymorphaceae bacterium]